MLRKVIIDREMRIKTPTAITSQNYNKLGSSLLVKKVVHDILTSHNPTLKEDAVELRSYLTHRATYTYRSTFDPKYSQDRFDRMLETLNKAKTILNNPSLEASINEILQHHVTTEKDTTVNVLTFDANFKEKFPYLKLASMSNALDDASNNFENSLYKLFIFSRLLKNTRGIISTSKQFDCDRKSGHIKLDAVCQTSLSQVDFWPFKEDAVLLECQFGQDIIGLRSFFQTSRLEEVAIKPAQSMEL